MCPRAFQKTKWVLGWKDVSRIFLFLEAVLFFSPFPQKGLRFCPRLGSHSPPVWERLEGGATTARAAQATPAGPKAPKRKVPAPPGAFQPRRPWAPRGSQMPRAPESPGLPIVSWKNIPVGLLDRWPRACMPLGLLNRPMSR